MNGTGALHVIFKLDAAEYAIPADDVLHMESFAGATRVPGTPPYVAGIVQIRGRVVPVVDLRARFGMPEGKLSIDSRVIVVSCAGRTVGLLADSAREVVRIEAEAIKPPPPVVAQQTHGFIRAVAQTNKRLLMLIDCAKVIGEEQEHGSGERSLGA
jgi:purine-binding chemotaxis protein CheW